MFRKRLELNRVLCRFMIFAIIIEKLNKMYRREWVIAYRNNGMSKLGRSTRGAITAVSSSECKRARRGKTITRCCIWSCSLPLASPRRVLSLISPLRYTGWLLNRQYNLFNFSISIAKIVKYYKVFLFSLISSSRLLNIFSWDILYNIFCISSTASISNYFDDILGYRS